MQETSSETTNLLLRLVRQLEANGQWNSHLEASFCAVAPTAEALSALGAEFQRLEQKQIGELLAYFGNDRAQS